MIIDIFIAARKGEDTLQKEIALKVKNVSRIAGIADTLIDAFGETKFLFDALQKHGTRVGSQFATVELDGDGLLTGGCGGGGVVVHSVFGRCGRKMSQYVMPKHFTTTTDF